MEDTEMRQITKQGLETLYQEVPKPERHFRIMVQNVYTASVRRVASTLIKDAAERYREFIANYPQLEQRVPSHQIASCLGITLQSPSRIKGKVAR